MSDTPHLLRDLRHWQFSASEVVALTGVASGTLQNWLARGVIHLTDTQRRGPHRIYAFVDVAVIAVAASLTRLRVPPSVITVIVDDVARRAATLQFGWMARPSIELMLGELEYKRPTVLIFHPDKLKPDSWHVLQAHWDAKDDFDPSDLPEAFIVLKLDELIGRLLEAAEGMKPSTSIGAAR
jgi:DNA-binding transcriptional MerR regulator